MRSPATNAWRHRNDIRAVCKKFGPPRGTSGGSIVASPCTGKVQLNADQYPEMHADLTLEEVRQSIHELRVHKIELQMQNDELRQSQIALEESRTRFRDLYDNALSDIVLSGRRTDGRCESNAL